MILTNAPCERHGWPLRECIGCPGSQPAVDDHGLTVNLDADEHRAAADLATAAGIITGAIVGGSLALVLGVVEIILGRRKP